LFCSDVRFATSSGVSSPRSWHADCPALRQSCFAISALLTLCGPVLGAPAEIKPGPLGIPGLPRVKLASEVVFPTEKLVPTRGGLHRRIVTSSVVHSPGHVVEMLYDAVDGAQIRDPLSGRIVWVPRTKLGPTINAPPPEAEDGDETYYRPHLVTSARPIRFPLRRHDGRYFGDTTIPAGEKLRITAEEGEYIRAETRDLSGWVKKESFGYTTDRPLTALVNLPVAKEEPPSPPPTAPPQPEPTPASVPFKTSKSHNYVEFLPLTLTAEVLGRQKYPMAGQKGGFWSTEVKPIDLALAWGPFMQSGRITARMQYRSAVFHYCDPFATVFSANFHMAVDDPEVRKQLLAVRVGDIVRLRGSLIRLEHPRGKANPAESTITGAFCYTMLCRAVEKLSHKEVSAN